MAWKHNPALAAALLVVACGSSGTTVENPTPDEASAAFNALEQRLLNSSYLELTARIESTGAVSSVLEGSLIIDGDRVLLGFDGTIAGKAVVLELESDGTKMTGGSETLSFEVETPPALAEGLIVGITRMGMLHNLAVLATGNPPQATYGEAKTWVTVSDITAGENTLSFGIAVEGTPSATAKLTLNTETGLPAKREQTVRLVLSSAKDGEMNVVENYASFSVR